MMQIQNFYIGLMQLILFFLFNQKINITLVYIHSLQILNLMRVLLIKSFQHKPPNIIIELINSYGHLQFFQEKSYS